MHIRPRCREWMPLATQQMRLRNLVRISGINIESSANSKLYYTLHYTTTSNAFYTSEMVQNYDGIQSIKWLEISCPETLKSNSKYVCVRIWEYVGSFQSLPTSALNSKKVPGLNTDFNISWNSSSSDKLLFTWGVYFSGLILVSNQLPDVKCISNSLIFQMNGEKFASPEHFTTSTLREQLSLSYQRYSQSVPCRHLSDDCIGDEFLINSPKVSRSSSPIASNSLNTEGNIDIMKINKDLLRMSKARYLELHCIQSEVRKSYSLQKLLRIQDMQRRSIQYSKDIREVTDDICAESVLCLPADGTTKRQRQLRHSKSLKLNSSMGRTLSVLLSQQNAIDPEDMARAQILQKVNETLRFNVSLLQREYEKYVTKISSLRKKLSEHNNERLSLHSQLVSRHKNLNSDKEALSKQVEAMIEQIKTKKQIECIVYRRMSSLCRELREIYPIGKNKNGFFTLNNIPFPNMDSYINDAKYANTCSLENVSPMTLSASLGYVAHLVQMIALILNRPLRNPINHEGSRTRILDTIKDIPDSSREFPLYTRSTIPSKPVKYAIYLLNQNIAQLNFELTGVRCDVRATIENILQIFDSFKEIQQTPKDCEIGVVEICKSQQSDWLSKSRSSIDMNHIPIPQINIITQPIPINVGRSSVQRVSRSVGSYSDCEDDFDGVIENNYSNSDSNITFHSEHV